MGKYISKCFKSSASSDLSSIVDNDQVEPIISVQNVDSTRSIAVRIVQNFTLLWLDSNIDEQNSDFKNSLTQLRRIVNTIDTFTNSDQCMNFLTTIKNEKVFMIVSGTFSQSIIPAIHDLSQLDSIYIFCTNKSKYVQWTSEWTKVKGVFTQIDDICDVLKKDTQQCDHDSISISVTSKNLNRLEPSFMYTQLLKEILLEMDYDDKVKTELVEFCRIQFQNNSNELKIIDEFERDYHAHTPIWWYTCECFTYQMINRALRIQDVEVIIKMGFFLRDVHRHLEQLHSKLERNNIITVYRGKTMLNNEFGEIKKKQDGLLAFNTFLSTSVSESVSLEFARKSLKKPTSVGVLFQITADPSISSTPFAPISSVSAIPNEEEILFSMHTVFRIGQITQIQDRIWRVELTLTSDNDEDLKQLTEYIRQQTSDSTKWERLGQLLIIMGKFDRAEEIFKVLLQETFKNDEKTQSSLYYHLGNIKKNKGDYREALELYQKSHEIQQKYADLNPTDLVNNYNSIAFMHDKMGDYSTALEFYQKALEIAEKLPLSNQINSAEICNNIAAAYDHIGDYTKALEFYQKSLDICLKPFSSTQSNLATADKDITQNYQYVQEYLKAIEAYQKTLEIRQKTLPPNHPDLAAICNSIGLLHCSMGQYSNALDSFHKELEIKQKSLSENHPEFAFVYNNIAMANSNTNNHAIALEFYQKSLDISSKSLPSTHPDLGIIYNNIGLLHMQMGDCSKALTYLEKALDIKQSILPSDHQDLFTAFTNMGLIYWNMGEYSKALPYYERAVEIIPRSLSENHPALAALFNTLGLVYSQTGNYSKALGFFEKSLEIKQAILPADHPDLAKAYNHIGLVHFSTGEYSKALPFYERAVEIGQRVLPPDHPYLQAYQATLAEVQRKCNSL